MFVEVVVCWRYGGVVVVVILWFIVVDYSEIIRNINTDYLQERIA